MSMAPAFCCWVGICRAQIPLHLIASEMQSRAILERFTGTIEGWKFDLLFTQTSLKQVVVFHVCCWNLLLAPPRQTDKQMLPCALLHFLDFGANTLDISDFRRFFLSTCSPLSPVRMPRSASSALSTAFISPNK